jgi:hypothetical protein
MTPTPGLSTAAVRAARWGLPWLSVLALSAGLAYAMTLAVANGAPAGDAPATRIVAQAPAEAPVSRVPGWSAATPAAIDRFSSEETCDTSGGRLLYIGLLRFA